MRGGIRPTVAVIWWRVLIAGLMILVGGHGARAESVKTRSASKRVRQPSVAGVTYTVRPGDTLWSVARRHGVPLVALRQANDLAPGDGILAGRHLVIPSRSLAPGQQEPPSLAEISLERPAATPRVELIWPVVARVMSSFGPRGAGWHGGIDLGAEQGAQIRAAAAGMVITSGREHGYGNVVKIWHFDDVMTVYAHNLENYVRVGDWVQQGQVIGSVGATGRASAPHLHFEVRLAGKKYDPGYWLSEAGTGEVVASTAGGPSRLR